MTPNMKVALDENGEETDESLRARIINAYGKWGAFCTAVIESSGVALDHCAKYQNLERVKK